MPDAPTHPFGKRDTKATLTAEIIALLAKVSEKFESENAETK